jgi:hypothetical protein
LATEVKVRAARVGKDTQAVEAALADRVVRTKRIRDQIEALSEAATRGGEAENLQLARYHHHDAAAELAHLQGDRKKEISERHKAMLHAAATYEAVDAAYGAGTTTTDVILAGTGLEPSQAKALAELQRDDASRKRLQDALAECVARRKSIEETGAIVMLGAKRESKASRSLATYAHAQARADLAKAKGDRGAEQAALESAQKAAGELVVAADAEYRAGMATTDLLIAAINHRHSAKIAIASQKDDRAAASAARDEHRAALLSLLKTVHALYEAGARGGEAEAYYYAACAYAVGRIEQIAIK